MEVSQQDSWLLHADLFLQQTHKVSSWVLAHSLLILGGDLPFPLLLLGPAPGQLQCEGLLLIGCPAIVGGLGLLTRVSQCSLETLFHPVVAVVVWKKLQGQVNVLFWSFKL